MKVRLAAQKVGQSTFTRWSPEYGDDEHDDDQQRHP